MLSDLFPRLHARLSTLPLMGRYVEEFVIWLQAQGYPRLPIRLRIRELPRIDALLRRQGIHTIGELSYAQLVALAPDDSQEDVYLTALVRSLARFLDTQGMLKRGTLTPAQQLVEAYRAHLGEVRGLAESTLTQHTSTALELLTFLHYDKTPGMLKQLELSPIEAFVKTISARLGRESLQHTVAQLRSFLRFLIGRGELTRRLDTMLDTPRVYRGERLPRSLPWQTVQSFLAAIDRSTPMGRRDYAMFLLITTYGLRTSEVAALRLDDIQWRVGELCIARPKIKTPLVLPLTSEVGAALLEYLRDGRPALARREVFLRARAPAGPLAPTAVTEAFQGWVRRARLPIPYQGPHCLRHSLAVHLLRQGASLKAIGDLLGHRSRESTCVYLRLQLDDLREAALEVPSEVHP